MTARLRRAGGLAGAAVLLTAIAVAGVLAVSPADVAAAGHHPKADSTSTSPSTSTFDVTCNNGRSYTVQIAGDGTARIPNLPAGTRCRVLRTVLNDVQVAPPVPGGASVRIQFGVPTLKLDSTVGRPGFTMHVVGTHFPPGATISLAWNVGLGGTTLAVANANGRFSAHLLILAGDRTGPRRLVASVLGAPQAKAGYLVVPGPAEPEGADRPPVVTR